MIAVDLSLALFAILAGACAIVYRARTAALRKKLSAARRHSAEVGSFMTLFSKNIRNVRDSDNWMNVTARYVADTVAASVVCIFTRSEDKSLHLTGSSGGVPRVLRALMMDDKRSARERDDEASSPILQLLTDVADQREPVMLDDPRDARLEVLDPFAQIVTLMAVPIIGDGEVQGVLCAVNSRRAPRAGFDRDQFGRLKFLSHQVVLAQNIMFVYAGLSKQQRISQELQFARGLQRSLLPRQMPVWGRFIVHAFTRASKEVSGDFYDFVEIDENRLLVVIGDACGKGIPACMIMSMTRSFIRSNAGRFTSLKDMLTELNDNLYRDMGDGRYITLGACLLNRRESTMEYARAGHTELLMYVHEHIRTINPDGAGLGLLPGMLAEFDTFCIELLPDMEMLLFTDGINEATNPAGEYFGVESIKKIFVKSCSERDQPHDTIARIMGSVDDFSQDPKSQADDQTIVIIRHM